MAGVLVIGATGYIGGAVARAARRDGYTVYAQTRSDSKATSLAADELIPLVCDPANQNELLPTVAKCEFIIDCTSNYENPNAVPDACAAAIKGCSGEGAVPGLRKHYVYTSGALVHGDRPGETVTEDQIGSGGNLAWRVDIEKSLLANTDLSCTVMRPAFLYGRSGGFVAKMLFQKPPDGEKLKVAGRSKRWSWVHVDDLADAYVRLIKRGSIAAGRVYDLGEPFGPTYEELRVAAAKLAGYDGEVEHVEAEGFEALMDMTIVVDCKRARDELGWCPRHTGIMAQLPLYYESYKASM